MIDLVCQIGVVVFGAPAIWFVGRKEHWKKWGYVLGMCSQPFWIVGMTYNRHWGMLALSLFYTYSWGQGIYNYWIKEEEQREMS